MIRSADAEEKPDMPGLIVYNADAGRRVSKPRYYIFEVSNFREFIKSSADTTVAVQVQKVARSMAQIMDPAAPEPSGAALGSFMKCTITKAY